MKKIGYLSLAFLALSLSCGPAKTGGAKEVSLLHVSFDISRELFKAENAAFLSAYQKKTGTSLKIEQSHAGASRQARAVVDGLGADLLSFNQWVDMQFIYEKSQSQAGGPIIDQDWQKKYPHEASPFSSTVAFVVRKGNPQGVHDWADLVKPGIQVVVANPKTSATGRYGLLNAYAYGLKSSQGQEAGAREYWKTLLSRIPTLPSGGRDATTVFADRGVGDVLVTLEAEAYQVVASVGKGRYEIVVPSYLVDAKLYTASTVRSEQDPQKAAAVRAYWEFVYGPEGQEIAAEQYFRPTDPAVAEKHRDTLPPRNLFTVEEVFGSWKEAQERLFRDGALFDQLFRELGKN